MSERRQKKAPPLVAAPLQGGSAGSVKHVWPLTDLKGLLSQDPGGRGIADLVCPCWPP